MARTLLSIRPGSRPGEGGTIEGPAEGCCPEPGWLALVRARAPNYSNEQHYIPRISLRERNTCTTPVEAKLEPLQLIKCFTHARLSGLGTVDQKEASSTSARELSPERTGI